MKYDTIAQILTESRLFLETKVIENSLTRLKYTSELDFLQSLTVLIPSDLLYSLNLNYPPLLSLRLWFTKMTPRQFLIQRCRDINLMVDRILYWYDTHLPPITETNKNDIDCLLEIKSFFLSLKSSNEEYAKEIERSYSQGSQYSICPCDHLYCSLRSLWDDTWELCCYGYYYSWLLYCHDAQPLDPKFEIRSRYQGAFGSGGARRYYCPLNCCNDSNSTCCDGCRCECYYCYWGSSDHYHHHSNNGYHHSYYHHDHYHHSHNHNANTIDCDKCCRECIRCSGCHHECQQCCRGLGGCCDFLGKALTCRECSCPKCDNCDTKGCDNSICHGCGGGCGDCGGGCGDCGGGCGDCKGCDGDGAGKGIMTLCGIVSGAIAMIGDALSGLSGGGGGGNDHHNDDNETYVNTTLLYLDSTFEGNGGEGENVRRALEDLTSPEYTPSIILMAISILIFFPRVLSHVVICLTNLRYSLALNRTWKVLFIMFGVALPLSIILCIWGGASYWTFVTIGLMFLHVIYALLTMAIKKIDSDLIDVSFLSCGEWRELNLERDGKYLHGIITTLTRQRTLIRNEIRRIASQYTILVPFIFLWPHLFKAYLRVIYASEISLSRQLNARSLETLAQKNNWVAEPPPANVTVPVAIAIPIGQSLISPKDRI